MKDGSLLSFLKPKAIPVPSTVRDAAPVMIRASDHINPTLVSMASRHPSSSPLHVGAERGLPLPSLGIQQTGSGFIKRFEEIVKYLPENIRWRPSISSQHHSMTRKSILTTCGRL
jgi:hypothetical protein